MIEGSSDWAAQRMAEFLSAVTSFRDQASAELNAVERIAEAVQAEIVAIVRDRVVSTSIGFPHGKAPLDDLLGLVDLGSAGGSLRGFATSVVGLDDETDARLIVARIEDEEFTPRDLNLLRGMARVLTLGLRTLRSVEAERTLRERSERQAAELRESQKLFERLSKIQRSISHRAALQDVFDSITSSTGELLGEPDAIIGLRLVDEDDPGFMELVSSAGVTDEMLDLTRRLPVGDGAGGQAIEQGRLVIVEEYPRSSAALVAFTDEVSAAMGAPVFEQDKVVGSLVFASRRPGRRFSKSEQEILLAFAQHASLALRDARKVHELKESFSESLTGISNKAASEKHELVQQLHQAQKMEAVGRLAGGIAHDFNNMLMVILTSATLLKESMQEQSGDVEDVDEIIDASQRAGRLVRQLLTFSRKEVPEFQSLDINSRLEEMSGLLRTAAGSRVSLDVSTSSEEVRVRLDPTHLEQVLLNLAVNARDAMPDGGTLSIRSGVTEIDAADPLVPAGRYLSLEVSDSGSGIPKEKLEHIFEPFFTTKPQGQGTGLGLATVYAIVSGAGGKLDVRSEVNKGTSFTIYLPLEEEHEDVAGEVHESEAADRSTGRRESLNVLIVDDEASVRELVRRILQRSEHHVTCCSSGREALRLISSDDGNDFDLVLSDIVMPEMTGIELLREMRASGATAPVVLMSGYTDARIVDPEVIASASGFLEKPFDRDTLRAMIERACDDKVASPAMAGHGAEPHRV